MLAPRLPNFHLQSILVNSLLHHANHRPAILIHCQRLSPYSYRHASTTATPPSPLQRVASAKNKTAAFYAAAVLMSFLGLTYAAVPIYRLVCQKTGWGGTPITDSSRFTAEHMVPVPTVTGRRIKISFSASTSDTLPWTFRPLQREVNVFPGETALAFYKARNKSSEDIIGIATYNVTPPQAAQYFNKIQCFCFDEQKLAAGEEVDMPVFFFIDNDFVDDPLMTRIDSIVLSYTFFKAKYDKSGALVPVEEVPQAQAA